ncbi:MAG: Crossover junction endodeoxyribonuclease RuvC [Candidatus Moranbacteria bacterium GW2011_GWC2_37_73]|nr:MAG: Crossover junction endodeoxyribonuclease RuvC [Candidatus Moranbacteria bacterium GW2011_GWC2_37_73]
MELIKNSKLKIKNSPKTLRVLGVDPGTAIVGWAILDEKKGCVTSIAYGHITTSPKNSTAERLFEVVKDLEQIIEKYKPDEAAVEDLFFFKNVKTVMKVNLRDFVLAYLNTHRCKSNKP